MGSNPYSNSHTKNINILGKNHFVLGLLGRCSSCTPHTYIVETALTVGMLDSRHFTSPIHKYGYDGKWGHIRAVFHQIYLVWEPEIILACCYWEILCCLQSIILQLKFVFVVFISKHCVQHLVRKRSLRTQLISKSLQEYKPDDIIPLLKAH